MDIRRTVLRMFLVVLLLGGATMAAAQTDSGGQFCVRAFDDRNGNQELDGGEPFLTRGVGAQLLDAGGLVVATALIDNSPTASLGVICFTGLTYGQYSILVTSPDFARTTPDSMTVSINPGELPALFVYGAQRIEAPAASTGGSGPTSLSPDEQTALIERVVIAAGAALIVIVIMLALGVIIYLLAFRNRLERAVPDVYMSPRVTTGSHPAVRASDSGEHPKL